MSSDWRERLARSKEELKTRLRPIRTRHRFQVVSAAHDAGAWIEQHLDSIHEQRYPRQLIRHVLVDDASRDDTEARVLAWLAAHPEHAVEYIRNTERQGGCANLTREFRRSPAGSIVLQVDGDDWLPDAGVFDFLNRVYQDGEVWMTYNSWQFPDGRPSVNSQPIPDAVIESGAYRDYLWISSHLHSFRSELFKHVRDESLIDPATGQHWTSAVDMSHYFPMLELAGRHARHVRRATYVYNLHPGSLINSQRERQKACELSIRALPRYRPLADLR